MALRGQTHSKTKGKKTQNVQNATEVFLGDNNMLEELPKWQANSKWLIANICLQCYMNYAIKTHITCIFFSLTTQMNPLLLLSLSQCSTYINSLVFCHFHILSVTILSPPKTRFFRFFFYFLCVLINFFFHVLLQHFSFAGVFLCCGSVWLLRATVSFPFTMHLGVMKWNNSTASEEVTQQLLLEYGRTRLSHHHYQRPP